MTKNWIKSDKSTVLQRLYMLLQYLKVQEALLEVRKLVGMQEAMEGLKMIDYNDRGRLKWAGFYLSDRTEVIDEDIEQRANKKLAKE